MYFKNEAGKVYIRKGCVYVELDMYSIRITPKIEGKENIELFLRNEFETHVEILKEAVEEA